MQIDISPRRTPRLRDMHRLIAQRARDGSGADYRLKVACGRAQRRRRLALPGEVRQYKSGVAPSLPPLHFRKGNVSLWRAAPIDGQWRRTRSVLPVVDRNAVKDSQRCTSGV